MSSRLIHPRMTEMLQRDFFPQACTIEQQTETQDTTGEVIRDDGWNAVPDLTELPCKVGEISGGERRTNTQIYVDSTHMILIAGHHPEIEEAMRAIVDSQAYDIQLVVLSTEEAVMRLVVRIVL